MEAGDIPVLVDVREYYEADIADLPEVGQLRIPMAELTERMEEMDKGSPSSCCTAAVGPAATARCAFLLRQGYSTRLQPGGWHAGVAQRSRSGHPGVLRTFSLRVEPTLPPRGRPGGARRLAGERVDAARRSPRSKMPTWTRRSSPTLDLRRGSRLMQPSPVETPEPIETPTHLALPVRRVFEASTRTRGRPGPGRGWMSSSPSRSAPKSMRSSSTSRTRRAT